MLATFAVGIGDYRRNRGYRAIACNLLRGYAMGYIPELNVLCPIATTVLKVTSL